MRLWEPLWEAGESTSLVSGLSDIVTTRAVVVIIVIVLQTTGGREREFRGLT